LILGGEMSQLNIHTTAAFEKQISQFMRVRGIKTKSEAIRVAIEEGLAFATRRTQTADFSEWRGLGNRAPLNPAPRFRSDADLWR
jgi:hypothetical protein